jgi:hypothetical protein
MCRACLPVLTLLTLCTAASGADRGPLELIPDDATGGVAIRNLNELRKKGDEFIKDAGIKDTIRFSDAFEFVLQFLNVKGGVDMDGSAAVVAVNEKVVGIKLKDANNERFLNIFVVAVPFKDVKEIAKGLGLKEGDLKPGKFAKREIQGNFLGSFGKLAYVEGSHVFLGNDEKAIESVVKSKGLTGALTEAHRKRLGDADVLLHLGTLAWGELWKEMLREVENRVGAKGETEEAKAARQFVEALATVRFALGAIRLDKGIGVHFTAVFPKEGADQARQFLETLRGGDGPSHLKGLPEGNTVAAQAATGDGSKNGPIARSMMKFLLEDVLEEYRIVSPADRSNFLNVFHEVWVRLRGSRFALYKTADERKQGLFSVVGILDTEDPEKFLDELRQLARLGSAEGLDVSTPEAKEASEKEIEKLIQDLGARRFKVRDAAEARLRLIGEQVLPHLEKAEKSGDAEVARRAKQLRHELVTAAEVRRKEIVSKELPLAVKPSFAFLKEPEKVGDDRVTVVAVKLRKEDAGVAPKLRNLFGPDWNRVRMAVHGKQVVMLVGSDTKLLEQALANLKGGKPGLAGAEAVKKSDAHLDAARKVEFHVSLQAVAALARAADVAKPGLVKPGGPLTSFALTVERDRVQVDVRVPSSEIRATVQELEEGPRAAPAEPKKP